MTLSCERTEFLGRIQDAFVRPRVVVVEVLQFLGLPCQ